MGELTAGRVECGRRAVLQRRAGMDDDAAVTLDRHYDGQRNELAGFWIEQMRLLPSPRLAVESNCI